MTKHASFSEKLKLDENTGCLLWTRHTNQWGYGMVRVNGKYGSAHRFAYERAKGEIPENMTIDHLCKNTKCCNPDHLEAVTMRENLMRGTSPSAKNAQKTHCIKGHEFSEENTYRVSGRRSCRKCNLLASKKYRSDA